MRVRADPRVALYTSSHDAASDDDVGGSVPIEVSRAERLGWWLRSRRDRGRGCRRVGQGRWRRGGQVRFGARREDGLRVSALLHVRVRVRGAVARLAQRLELRRRRGPEFALAGARLRHREVVERRDVVGLELDRLAEDGNGLRVRALLQEQLAEVHERRDVVRIGLEHATEGGKRVLLAILGACDQAEHEVGVRRCRRRRGGSGRSLDRGRQIGLVHPRDRQVDARRDESPIDGQRGLELRRGLRVVELLEIGDAEVVGLPRPLPHVAR